MAAFEIKEILFDNLHTNASVYLFRNYFLSYFLGRQYYSQLEVCFMSDLKSHKDQSIVRCVLHDACCELFRVFGDFNA